MVRERGEAKVLSWYVREGRQMSCTRWHICNGRFMQFYVTMLSFILYLE